MTVRNHITLIGNLGQAPKTLTLPSGTQLTEFSLATNDSYRDRNGNKVTRTEWHRIKVYGKTAETMAEYLTTGSQVAVTGTLRYRQWTDQYDQKRNSAEIVVEEFTFLDNKPREGSESDAHAASVAAEPEAAPAKKAKAKSKRRATKDAPVAEAVTPAEELPF